MKLSEILQARKLNSGVGVKLDHISVLKIVFLLQFDSDPSDRLYIKSIGSISIDQRTFLAVL